MFTWICPKCGREVPPAYTDCPDCAAKTQAPQPEAAPVVSQPMPPPARPPAPEPAPQYQPPPPQYQQAPPQYQQGPPQYQQGPPQYQQAPPQQYAPPQYQQQQPQYPPPPAPPTFYAPPPERTGLAAMPTWLLSILFTVVFGGLVFGVYYLVQNSHKTAASTQDTAGTLETPAGTAAGGSSNNPLLKQVEVVGLRLTQNKAKKTEVRFLLVNHSGGDIQDLAGNISLRARTSKQDEEPIGVFSFKLPSLGPYESKDMAAVLNTKLKVYELPDWQNLQAQLKITSP
jgi:hypothetical protein